MKDCSNDVIKFHNDEVTLAESQRANMRDRRGANRTRLKSGLAKMNREGPDEHVIQGSYAMKTMTQHPDNAYDIDDGAAFSPNQLLKDGRAMTPAEAKATIKEALEKDGRLPSEPKIMNNCVRVEYEAGYHVDIPVYRVTKTLLGGEKFEIAGIAWRKTNPREISEWFDERVAASKTGAEDDPQLRHMVRLIKKFARANCGDQDTPSGLLLTVLVDEAHKANQAREDEAFRSVLQRLKMRLDGSWRVWNPRDASEELTKPADEARLQKLAQKIQSALTELAPLDEFGCSRARARRAWDAVFMTDYFTTLEQNDRASESSGSKTPDKPVNKQGGGTYA